MLYPQPLSVTCPLCGAQLVIRARVRDGRPFVGCGSYPRCSWASNVEDLLVEVSQRLARAESATRIAVLPAPAPALNHPRVADTTAQLGASDMAHPRRRRERQAG